MIKLFIHIYSHFEALAFNYLQYMDFGYILEQDKKRNAFSDIPFFVIAIYESSDAFGASDDSLG